MEKCAICGDDIVSKRKDAKYCKKAKCRKKAHLNRKEEAARTPPKAGALKASVVVTFPDGSRWLMELTPLKAEDEARLPSLKQVDGSEHEIRSGSDPAQPNGQPADSVGPPTPAAAPGISSDQIPRAEADSSPTPSPLSEPAPKVAEHPAPSRSDEAAAPLPTKHTEAVPISARTELRTVELFFTDHRGRRIAFTEAVRDRGPDGWRVRRYVKAALGFSSSDGYGLGGSPGRWRDHYPGRSPTEFGLDADLGVLYMDDADGQAHVADVGLLRETLGAAWTAQLRGVACRRP